MTLYIVTVASKYPAAFERPGQLEIEAKNKKDAIKEARRQMGWQSRHDGPLIYTAEKAA